MEREAHEAQLGFRSKADTVEVAVVDMGGFDKEASLTAETDLADRLKKPLLSELAASALLLPVLLKFSRGIDAALNKDLPTMGLSLLSKREARPEDIV